MISYSIFGCSSLDELFQETMRLLDKGNIKKIQEFEQNGLVLTSVRSGGESLLQHAVDGSRIQAVKSLFDLGCDPLTPCHGNSLLKNGFFLPIELAACQAAWRSESQSALEVFTVLWEAADYQVREIQDMKDWISKNANSKRADYLLQVLESRLTQENLNKTLPVSPMRPPVLRL